MNDQVNALCVYGGQLIAAGDFTVAGGQPANRIAAWDGTSWHPLGAGLSGPNGWVSDLAVYDGELVAGGGFTIANGAAANYVARWDGISWRPLGTATIGVVNALEVYGDRLIAGGYFGSFAGLTFNQIAQWDGSSWTPLGAGVHGYVPYVYALTVFNDDLVVGGRFTLAGGNVASRWARWHPADPTVTLQPANTTVFAGLPVTLRIQAAGTGPLTYQWQKDGVALSDNARVSGTTAVTLTIDPTMLSDSAAYRVMVSDDCNSMPSEAASLTVMQALGDVDLDGDVDQVDFGRLQACFTGTGIAQTDPVCADALLDYDNDVDQGDFNLFRACMTGSGVAPAPTCVR